MPGRAWGLSVLMLAAASMPMAWAAVPSDPDRATAGEWPQANAPGQGGLVSLDFQDADIRNVLKALAFKSGVNIVAAPDVTGVVNIELKDVPWQKALDVILSTYGYGFVRKDNIITVMTIEKLKKYREDSLALENQEPLISKTYTLSFARAQDAMKIIEKMISKRGFINFDERTNSIIIRDVESNLELISGVIKSIDTATPRVSMENKIIESKTGLVSLDFQDADIRNVLKALALKSGVNIVAAPDVTGIVNIELKNVPWQKALDVILSTYGYGYVIKDKIITVMTVEKLKKYHEDSLALQAQEPLISRTFPLSFAKAEDVLKIIEKMISKRGFINFDERTNSIIIRDVESNLELISGVIKSLDTITPEVMIETNVIETDLNNTDTLGIDWVIQGSITGATRPTIFPFTNGGKGLFGGAGHNGSYVPSSTTSFAIAPVPGLGSSTAPGFTYGTINASSLSATLAALSTHQNTRTLSNPRVVTLDNEKVSFNVGLQYPMPQYSFNASTGQQQISGYTFTPIGINFEVTPHVNNAGWITLDLHPDISAINQLVTLQQASGSNPPVQIPELSDRTIQTKVMVESGKTLVIAGLISDTKTSTKNKVPFLGDIPWLGKLFSSNNTTVVKTELLIFLTPHIIKADDRTALAAIQ